jgi:hypothetical protein
MSKLPSMKVAILETVVFMSVPILDIRQTSGLQGFYEAQLWS